MERRICIYTVAMPSVFQAWISLKGSAWPWFSHSSCAGGDLGTAQPCLRDSHAHGWCLWCPHASVTAAWKLLLLLRASLGLWLLAALANSTWGSGATSPKGWQQRLPTGEQDLVGGPSLVLLALH